MEMTEKEIKANYASAKNKARQIKILADLNCCRPVDIKKILGLSESKTAPKAEKPVKPNMELMKEALENECKVEEVIVEKEEPKKKEAGVPESIIRLAAIRLEELENTIKAAEQEYKEIASFLGMGA